MLATAIHAHKKLTTLTEHFTEAPFSSNTLTHSSLPLSHAYISGVKPGKEIKHNSEPRNFQTRYMVGVRGDGHLSGTSWKNLFYGFVLRIEFFSNIFPS